MVQRLILIDRNAVACVKESVAGKDQPQDRLTELRGLDKRRYTISPILSIIEGQSGRRENKLELQKTLEKESKAVGKFFKRARTDSDYLASSMDSFASVFSAHTEHAWDAYISFVAEAQEHIFQPVASNQRLAVEGKLIDVAKKHGVPLNHPVFLISIFVLYGSEAARQVLKPKLKYKTVEERLRAAYNVVSDLLVISRIGLIQSTISEADKPFSYIRYFTFDKGLSEVVNAIRIKSVDTIYSDENTVSTAVNATYSRHLFPEMDAVDLERFLSAIRGDSSA